MSDFINENPNVLDEAQLPKRAVDSAASYLSDTTNESGSSTFINLCSKETNKRLANILQDTDYNECESSILKDITDLNKLLTLQDEIDQNEINQDEINQSEIHVKDEDVDMDVSETILRESIDAQEIYDLIAHISDPEHPMSLGQLSIVKLDDIEISDLPDNEDTNMKDLIIRITPTITHCSLATLIGLGIRVRLDRALNPKYRPTIILKQGTHQSENQVNKQLNDKERVAAACENDQLLNVIRKMLSTCK
ncbi:hypothetical protein QEN19_004306 [Hanseniaspora menglaensis]